MRTPYVLAALPPCTRFSRRLGSRRPSLRVGSVRSRDRVWEVGALDAVLLDIGVLDIVRDVAALDVDVRDIDVLDVEARNIAILDIAQRQRVQLGVGSAGERERLVLSGAFGIDHDDLAGSELAVEDLLREHVLDLALDR